MQYIVAHGIATTLYGERAVIGSKHFVAEDEYIEISDTQQAEIDVKSGACSVVYFAIGGKLTSALCISDPPKAEAATAVSLPKMAGIKHIVMLTGDSRKAAETMAAMLGITQFQAQVLPEEKHDFVKKLKFGGKRIIMIGDGINDALALAAANVSVAMSDTTQAEDATKRVRSIERLMWAT